jgi:hypothetical protein
MIADASSLGQRSVTFFAKAPHGATRRPSPATGSSPGPGSVNSSVAALGCLHAGRRARPASRVPPRAGNARDRDGHVRAAGGPAAIAAAACRDRACVSTSAGETPSSDCLTEFE